MRWNRRFDGTTDSLRNRSHRPKTPHPNAHTQQEKTWIKNFIRRNPTISLIELYAKLQFQRGYQRHHTVIYKASRERFINAFSEQSSYSSVEFVKMAIKHFGYQPKIIQTDNGFEFTHFREARRTHPFDLYCQKQGIVHQLIYPRTPRHNGKVKRSHRNDNERFYARLSFYSYEDLLVQMKRYLYKSNRLPMQTLGWLTPMEKRALLMAG